MNAAAAPRCPEIHDSKDLPAVCAVKFGELSTRVGAVEGNVRSNWKSTLALFVAIVTCLGASGYLWYSTNSNASATAVDRAAIKDAGVRERAALKDALNRDRESMLGYLSSIQTDVREIRAKMDSK